MHLRLALIFLVSLFLTILASMTCSAIGVAAANLVFSRADLAPLRIAELDLSLLLIGIPVALVFWRPRNLIPAFGLLLLILFWFFVSARWDTSSAGSAHELFRLLRFETHGVYEFSSVAFTYALSASLLLAQSIFAEWSDRLSLKVYLPFWKRRIRLVHAAITNDVTFLDKPNRLQLEYRVQDPAYGRTPLHWACFCNNLESVTTLLKFDPEGAGQKDFNGNLPVHFAASADATVLTALLKAGSSLWSENKYANLPIHFIVAERNLKNLEILLKHTEFPISQRLSDLTLLAFKEKAWEEGLQAFSAFAKSARPNLRNEPPSA